MDINAIELKENVFNSSGQFTSHFCMATYLESAASGWCVVPRNMECSKTFPARYAGEADNMSLSYQRETEGPKVCHLGKVTWQCSVWLSNPKIVLNYMPLGHSRNDKTGTISITPHYWNHYFRPMFEKNAFQKYLKSLTLYNIDNLGKEKSRHKVTMPIFSKQSEAGLFGCR